MLERRSPLGQLFPYKFTSDDRMVSSAVMTYWVNFAKNGMSVNVESVVLGDGYIQEASRCIDTALSQDCWALIDGLHLAPNKFFETLQTELARVANVSRQSESGEGATHGGDDGKGHFLVWMTSQAHAELPSMLTQYLLKISWDSLLALLRLEESSHSVVVPSYSDCPDFKAAIVSSLSRITRDLATAWHESAIQRTLFAICVCHAVLLARQSVGWHGNKKFYPLSESTLCQALTHVLSDGNPQTMLPVLKNIYCDVISASSDQMYTRDLFDSVLSQAMTSSGDVIRVNNTDVPIPPSQFTPTEIASWLSEHLADSHDVVVVSDPHTATKWLTAERSERLAKEMRDLFNAIQQPGYEASLLSPGSGNDVIKSTVTLSALQSVLDVCREKLPALLELGNSNCRTLGDFDFPYHAPSELSVDELAKTHMPESLGFVLLRECVWFNQCVCKARQQIHELATQLFVAADYKLAANLKHTARSLLQEEVPLSWQHENEQPNGNVLLTWLSDLAERYTQRRSWLRSGMIPTTDKTPVGNLNSVWLGGLANPAALLLALCQEKAVLHDITINQVRIRCSVKRDGCEVQEQEAGMYLEGCHVINATWDAQRGALTEDGGDRKPLPPLYFYPYFSAAEEEDERKRRNEEERIVDVPVYINMSAQNLVCFLPLPTADDLAVFPAGADGTAPRARRCYVVLQTAPGPCERDAHKSRAYLARKKREHLTHVSPAHSELLSRSGTRMSSSTVTGRRMSNASMTGGGGVPKLHLATSEQQQHPATIMEFDERDTEHAGAGQMGLGHVTSGRSISSRSSEGPDSTNRSDRQAPVSNRIPNGGIGHTVEPAPGELLGELLGEESSDDQRSWRGSERT